jgi:predicted ATPase/DNA-binding SARP family transcriptional activator
MEFRILGPLEVSNGDRVLSLAAAKERALLALLLVDANRVVSSERLIEDLWDGAPPESATTSVRVLVSRLRKTLSEIDDGEVIVTRAPGYLVTVEPGELDASRFEALAARGHAQLAAGDAEGASRVLREALDLWRGPPLADVGDLERARLEATRLEGSRLGALEDRVDADLAVGRHAQLVSELEALTAAHPVRERLWSQRMLALYRAGRQADALGVYQELRRVLDEELGIEPSPEVVALETAIIRQDPTIARTPAADSSPSRTETVLPSGVVTLLLTDIEGSTPLWETKPVAMADALTRHDELMRSLVASHGGALLRTRGEGDSTFSVFARATDAADAALEAQAALSSEPWPSGIELRVRMSLTTGETVERDGDYYGTTVNRAARLRGVAAPGQILVSRSTADVIVDHIEGATLVELGEQALRGLRRPERTFELRPLTVAIDADPNTPEDVPLPAALVRTTTGVFVGREAELERLMVLWDDVDSAERKLVLLVGEAGIGKTRLAAEFALRAHEGGATVLYGRCDEDGGEPYQPFAEAVRTLVVASPGAAREKANLSRLLPDLAPQLGIPSSATLDDAKAERRALFEAVGATIAASSAQSSVVVVIDDLHWAAKPTLLMLRHLLRINDGSRVLVVATYRDTDVDRAHPLSEVLADLRREVDMTRLAVSGLDSAGIVAYVEATTGQELDERERRLADLVREQTEGNPFFVVEVLRHLVDTGAVYRSEGRWHADLEGIAAAGLPEGVRDVIGRRLGRLSDDANRALASAAVIGPTFSLVVLEGVMAGGHEDVLDAIEQSIRAGLITESGPGAYSFSHALIRQTLYEELTSTRRARMHRQVGEALEALPQPETHVEALAHHFAEAALDGQAAKAADYAFAAGQRSIERLAHEEAISQFERGLEMLEIDSEPDHGRRAELLRMLAIAKWSRGDRDGARDASSRAAVAVRRSGNAKQLAQLAVLRSALADLGVEDELAVQLCNEALEQLRSDEPALRARVLAAYARYEAVQFGRGREAQTLASEAVELARTAGDRDVLASAMSAHLSALRGIGRPERQVEIATELVELADKSNNHRSMGEALRYRSLAYLELGLIDDVRIDLETLESLGRNQRLWFAAAFATALRTAIAVLEGRFEAARELGELAAQQARGDFDLTTVVSGVMMNARMHEGNWAGAADLALTAAAYSSGLGPWVPVANSLAPAAENDLEGVRNALSEIVDGPTINLPHDLIRVFGACLMTDACARVGYTLPANSLMEVLRLHAGCLVPAGGGAGIGGVVDHYLGVLNTLLERWDEAVASFETALSIAERVGSPVFRTHTNLWYGRMLLDRGDPDDHERAVTMVQDALGTAEELGMALVARDARTLLRPPIPPALATARGLLFVGRDAELDRLKTLWGGVVEGARRVVFVAGEPGIGKTRLTAELAQHVHDQGGAVLFGRCDEDLGVPYQPFAEAIRVHAEAMPIGDITSHLSTHGADLVHLVPELSRLVPDAVISPGAQPEVERLRMFESVAAFLADVSSMTPVLLVLDDLHWGAKSTMLLLRHLARTPKAMRVMILGTYRDTDVDRGHPLGETLADMRRDLDVERVILRGLDEEGVTAFVAAAANQELDTREAELAVALRAGTEGNPFFLQEVMRHLVDTGAIYRSEGRWHTDFDNINEVGVPEGVRDVIGRRLAYLSENANRMLTVAAVVGPSFGLQLLESVPDLGVASEELLDAMDEAVRAGVISEATGGRYAFSHALVRQTLYAELSSVRRARLHRRVGEAIESLPDADDHVEELAHHFAEAALDGQVPKAVDYALAAGRRALERLAYEEAGSQLERGLTLLDLESVPDHERRAELFYTLATTRWSQGDREGAQTATSDAATEARLAGDVVRLAHVAVLRAALAQITVEDPLTQELCEEALERLGSEWPALRTRVLAAFARYQAFSVGRSREAETLAAEAVRLARDGDDLAVLASAVNAHLMVLQGLGRPEYQLELADELMDLASQRDDPRTLGEALMARALANFELGEMSALLEDVEALDDLGRRRRWWLPSAFATALRSGMASTQGRFVEAEALEREAALQAQGDFDMTVAVVGLAGVRTFHTGDIASTREMISWLREYSLGLRPFIAICDALMFIYEGDPDQARLALGENIDGATLVLPNDLIRAMAVGLVTDAVVRLGLDRLAEYLLDELRIYEGRLLPAGRGAGVYGVTDQFMAMLLSLLKRWDEAEAKFESALELSERIGAVTYRTQTLLWYGRMLLARGLPSDRDRANTMLQQSMATAEEIGMPIVAREAKELLASM